MTAPPKPRSITAAGTSRSARSGGALGGARSAPAVTASLAACGGDDSEDSTGTEAAAETTTATGTPASGTGEVVRGGTLTFARTLDAEAGLNPINAANNGSIFTIQQVFDQLVEVEGSEIVPGLAKSWEHSPDGLEWTFHLRDAKFSNGDPVTGEDVKFSIDRFADERSTSTMRLSARRSRGRRPVDVARS